MERPIAGFHRDEDGAWVAELSCGHLQHVRHDPPFQVREWTRTPEGRAGQVGSQLDCSRCDRREIPEGFEPYRRTATFTERTVPRGLLSRHTTKAGVWGVIRVESGELEYVIHGARPEREILYPGDSGIVVPEIEHEVHPLGPAAFHVEFLGPRA